MPFYFIQEDNLCNGTVQIGVPLAHHLQVLRYQKGDLLTLVDGQRNQYAVRITTLSVKMIECEILSKTPPAAPKKPLLCLGMALLKADKMDWAIQKASELGVDRVCPLITRRVSAKLHPDKFAHQQKRWFEIAKESAQQSERLEIPRIDTPVSLALFLEKTASTDMRYIFWEKAPPVPVADQIKSSLAETPNSGAFLIGPEGGFEKEEVDLTVAKGYIAVSLGERPVRAETAVLSALTILQYEIAQWIFQKQKI
jgi:16S rRNA (uracil1498-N3)-methyltransferase